MPVLQSRKIGSDYVAEVGLELMGISTFYGHVDNDDEEHFKFLDAALEDGATFWDTANIYSDSEKLIGRWFKRTGNRDKIFLATKSGLSRPYKGASGAPEFVKSCCEGSLRRLGVSQIDLYYLIRADPTVPIERTVGAMAELVKEGKVRYIGLSEVSSRTLRRAHAVHPISAVQIEYSPFFLDIEDEKIGLLRTCRELGVTVVAYSPLGRGLLAGRYKSPEDFEEGEFRKITFSKESFPYIMQLSDGLVEIGKKYNATVGQTTLAWILAQGKDIIPIPGTKNIEIQYLKENNASVDINLHTEEIADIRKLAEKSHTDFVDADIYPPPMISALFADTVPL